MKTPAALAREALGGLRARPWARWLDRPWMDASWILPGPANRWSLRVFSIRTLVATRFQEDNERLISEILRHRASSFLSTDYIF